MKSQSKSLETEYDRLMTEKDLLQKKLRIAGGAGDEDSGDKKDD